MAAAIFFGSGCATAIPERVRPDDFLTRLIPTMHSISPVHPSPQASLAAALPAASSSQRFTEETIAIEEPTFHELHSLAWQRELQAYTASVLNRATGPLADGPPLTTRARFTWTFDHRDSMNGAQHVAVALESVLPDGRVVSSSETTGEVSLWNETGAENALAVTMLAGLSAGLGVEVAMFALTAAINPIGWILMGGAFAIGVGSGVASGVVYLMRISAVQARWSDLYLQALCHHAADVREVLVADGVPQVRAP